MQSYHAPSAMSQGDAEAFKSAMRRLAGAIVMVTTTVDERPWGLTITSCTSISATPPRLLVSLASGSVSRHAIVAQGRFGASVLRGTHQRVAELGARVGCEKFVDGFCDHVAGAELESAMIAGALVHLDCVVERTVDVGDHTLIVGDVASVVRGAAPKEGGRGPLLYFDRAYRHLGDPGT